MMRALLFRLEAALVALGFAACRAAGPAAASNALGAVLRVIGPRLPVSRIAAINLQLALPDLSEAERRRVLRLSWENLGRTVAELANLDRLRETPSGAGWEMVGKENVPALVPGRPGMILTGHFANWEISMSAGAQLGLPVGTIYRAAENVFVDRRINAMRRRAAGADVPMFPKGAAGARGALGFLKGGGVLGLLTDQKLNDGIEASFFGHPAMTSSALASFALRFRCPVLPVHAVRIGPGRLRIIVEPPLPLPDSGDRLADIRALTETVNRTLERWIRDNPESWLWLHRRWPKEFYR